LGNRKAKATSDPYAVVALSVDTKSTGRFFQAMAQSAVDKTPPGPQLDALTAQKVFGWKNIHKHEDGFVGRRRDRAGRWRLAKVPYYSTNQTQAYLIEERIKQLGRLDRYEKELSKITRSRNIPSDWATPDPRCRAAIKAVGRYGQVTVLGRKQPQE
jgi:hypothetical protein